MAADGLRRAVNLYGMLLRANQARPLTLEQARDDLRDEYDDYEGESGRRAFIRDRQHLEAAGVPIEMSYATGKAGVPGWWIPRDRWFLGQLALSDDERTALLRASRMVDFDDVLWSRLAGAKLGAAEVGATDTVAIFVAPPALPAIQQARAHLAPIAFDYRGKARVVDPYALGNAQGHWYVVGFEHDAGELRVFRVDRIVGEVAEAGNAGSYTVPDDFDPLAHLPKDRWSFGPEVIEVAVAVDAEVAAIVAHGAGPGLTMCDRDDGRVELRFNCGLRNSLISWALGLGHRAEVLAPADLRDEIVARLRAQAAGELPGVSLGVSLGASAASSDAGAAR